MSARLIHHVLKPTAPTELSRDREGAVPFCAEQLILQVPHDWLPHEASRLQRHPSDRIVYLDFLLGLVFTGLGAMAIICLITSASCLR